MKRESFNPISVLATACVPWGPGDEFLEPVFRRYVRQLHAAGQENLYIFGTAGEGHAVTIEQFKRIAAVLMQETRELPGIRQLGVIGLSTAQVLERIEIGAELGYSHFQVSLPPWGRLNDTELDRYFADVLGPYPDLSFLHYNTSRGGRVLSGSEYARIQAAHPNLVATKSGGHTVASLLALFDKAHGIRHFLTELDYAVACLLGLHAGLLVSVSSCNPRRSHEFFDAGRQGDAATLRAMVAELNGIREKIVGTVTAAGGHMDGAFDKVYARLLNPEFPLELMSPYKGASQPAFEEFARWLAHSFPKWAGSDG